MEQAQYVSLRPPRRQTISQHQISHFNQFRLRPRPARFLPTGKRLLFFAIIPGMVHFISGRIYIGLFYFLSVCMFIACGLLFINSGSFGLIFFGFASAMHAYSIFVITSLRDEEDCVGRMIGYFIILAILQMVYTPVVQFCLNKTRHIVMVRSSERGAYYATHILEIIVLLVCAMCAVVFITGITNFIRDFRSFDFKPESGKK
jgi:hypothetical protein